MNKWLKIFLIIAGVVVIFLLSFQYKFLVNFPIGHDAGHHITNAINIEKAGLFNIINYKSMLYPIPWILFALLHKITQIGWPQLFIYVICLFLFLTSLAWTYFATRATDKWEIGITAGILLASSRWLSDALRIGFMAEAWGWFVFILCSYFLIKRKLWLFVIFSILLFFSHPLVFMVFIMVLIIYSIVILISKPDKENKEFIIKVLSFLFLAVASAFIFFPDKVHILLNISQFAYLEGARSLKTIMIDSDKRRILLYLISLVGIIKSIQFWRKNEIKFLFVVLFVSIILSESYLWGINFWVFRFYPYFEITISLFAAIGLYYLIESLPKIFTKYSIIKLIILGLLVYVLVLPNWQVNRDITVWQENNYQMLFTCPPVDRTAFDWVKNNTPADSIFLSPVDWGSWLGPISGRHVIESDSAFDPKINPDYLQEYLRKSKVNYLYFSSVNPNDPVIESDNKDFKQIYFQSNVRIYEIKPNIQ
jgi:hypothetical protein